MKDKYAPPSTLKAWRRALRSCFAAFEKLFLYEIDLIHPFRRRRKRTKNPMKLTDTEKSKLKERTVVENAAPQTLLG